MRPGSAKPTARSGTPGMSRSRCQLLGYFAVYPSRRTEATSKMTLLFFAVQMGHVWIDRA
jgi:hypothetical protein